jgi:zinc transport system substrate-binding protein
MKGTILFLAALMLFGCARQEDSSTRPALSVFVSIPPQAGLAKRIAGEQVTVRTLVGEGQSPHNYEPTARQLAQLGEADALFSIGVPFEEALFKKIVPLYPDLPIIGTQDLIRQRALPHAHHGEHCTHDHGAADPHVWLAPLHALTIAASISETLQRIDPQHAATYRENLHRLTDELEELDTEIRTKLAPYKGARFYVFHPSFGYFSDAYGLEQVAIELDGKSPTPRQLAGLVEQARIDDVKIVFVQKQFPAESARAMADAIGGSVVQLDPLAEDVVANLKQITESIVHALEQ